MIPEAVQVFSDVEAPEHRSGGEQIARAFPVRAASVVRWLPFCRIVERVATPLNDSLPISCPPQRCICVRQVPDHRVGDRPDVFGPSPPLIVDVFFCLTALVLAIAFLRSMAIERPREVRVRADFASLYNLDFVSFGEVYKLKSEVLRLI